MSIVRVGSTSKYADGWDTVFSKSSKAKAAKPSAAAKKTAKKPAARKSAKK